MEKGDQKENSGQETISDIKKNIDRLENKFKKKNNLKALKKELGNITSSLQNLDLFPKQDVLVKTGNGWEVNHLRLLLIKSTPSSAAEHFYLSGGGVLYKILPERFLADDYNQWRQLSPYAPGYPKWTDKAEASKAEYRKLAPFIFRELRYFAEQSL